MSVTFEFDDSGFQQLDKMLSQVPLIHRTPVMEKLVRYAFEPTVITAKRLIPIRPKPKGRNQAAHLRHAVTVKTVSYPNALVGIFGWDARKAPHGHLVEEGHVKVLWGNRTGVKEVKFRKRKRQSSAEKQLRPRLQKISFGRTSIKVDKGDRVEGKKYFQMAVDQTSEQANSRLVTGVEAYMKLIAEGGMA